MKHSRVGKDITGQRFGTLTTIRLLDERSTHGHKVWECLCDCGSVSRIIQGSLTTGNTTRCSTHPKNDYVIDDDVAWIDVSTGAQPDAVTMIDSCDLDRVLNYTSRNGKMRWIAHNSNNQGHDRWGNYVVGTDRKSRLHRLVMRVEDPQLVVDHKNGDTFDNRKSNLVVITRAENNKNMRRRVDNTTGGSGVEYDQRNDNYKARIQLHGVIHYLGTFNTLELANTAYRAAAKVLGFSERHGTQC